MDVKVLGVRPRKIPLVALVFSLVIPGLGQFYNAEPAKGLVIAGVCLGLALATYWLSGLTRISVALALLILWISAILDAYKTARSFGQPLDWYYQVPYVVTMLLLVGPVALPLLWRSPYFSLSARCVWTTVVIGAVLLFLLTPYLLSWLLRHMPELKTLLDQAGVHP
jgi:TM2 domain-containing membrane protein YozV